MLREMALGEFLALARRKVSKGKSRFTLYVPPKKLPPASFKAYREVVIEDGVLGIRYIVFTRPNPTNGGWLLHVKTQELAPFNPVISNPEVLLQK